LLVVFLLIYRKLRPYIEMLRKIVGIASSIVSGDHEAARSTTIENKLSKCVTCGTWIPADRVVAVRSGSSVYCSTECLEGLPQGRHRKIAG
jgi:hypothetical protein